MRTFTVFGLQRSGTNFLEGCIRNNFIDVKVCNTFRQNGIWKHVYNIENNSENAKETGKRGSQKHFDMIGKEISGVHIHKHPYSWIESILRKKVDIEKTYSFVTDKKNAEAFMIRNNLNIRNLAELHRNHSSYWMNVCDNSNKNMFRLRYEDLISSPEDTKDYIRKIAEHFNVNLKNEKNLHIPEKVGQSDKFTDQKREMYKNFKLQYLNWKQIEIINEILDENVVSRQGYELIKSKEEYNKNKDKQ